MAIKIIEFDKDGGPVVAEVNSGYAQPGSYTLLLWEANQNKVIMEEKGNFINSDDDFYSLPTPNEANDSRIVECISTVSITPPIKQYNIALRISQDDGELGSENTEGSTDSPTVTVDLFIQLKQKG
jgi:hypothetical protein